MFLIDEIDKLKKNTQINKYVNFSPGEYYLDLDCGRGDSSIDAAVSARTSGFVVGFDNKKKLIDDASKKINNMELGNILFMYGEKDKLIFWNEFFDVVSGNWNICRVNNMIKVFGEVYRVLKKGGRFILAIPVLNGHKLIEKKYFYTKNEYMLLLERSGFNDIEAIDEKIYNIREVNLSLIFLRAWKKSR